MKFRIKRVGKKHGGHFYVLIVKMGRFASISRFKTRTDAERAKRKLRV